MCDKERKDTEEMGHDITEEARKMLEAGNGLGAIALLTQAIAQGDGRRETLLLRARVFAAMGCAKEAEEDTDQCLSNREDEDACLLKAALRLGQDDTAAAITYYNKVKDKIVAIPTMFIWKMSNIGEVETIGTDINLNTAIRPTEYIKLYIDGSYNFMQAQDVTSPDGKTYKQQIAYTPRHSGSGTGTIETPWFCITYNLLFTSERFTKTQNTPDNRIRPYIDHSLSLFRIFNFGRHSLRIQADALNLTNKNYEVIRFYPMPGRNYKLTINYQI